MVLFRAATGFRLHPVCTVMSRVDKRSAMHTDVRMPREDRKSVAASTNLPELYLHPAHTLVKLARFLNILYYFCSSDIRCLLYSNVVSG